MKAKGKKAQGEVESNQNNGKNKDLSKIKCFHFHEYEHYVTKCLHRKSNKEPTTGVGGDALSCQIELDITLITCLVRIVIGSDWYLDFGASYHITVGIKLGLSIPLKNPHLIIIFDHLTFIFQL